MTYGSVRRRIGVLCLAGLLACAAAAQQATDETPAPAKLEITLDAYGAASVSLRVPGTTLPAPLAPAFSQAFGCNFENPKDRESGDDWVFSGRCAAFRKRGLLVAGQVQFAPLLEALKKADVQSLNVTIRHPRTGFSRLADNDWTLNTASLALEYSKTLSVSAPAPHVPLAFGYRLSNFLALSLLLFPIALAMVMRWAALRAPNADPLVVWFTYWRMFGWVIAGSWLLWVQGSTVLDCAALARFLLNDSSKALLLQVAFYLVPPLLVQLICTLTSGAVLARVSGERWMLPVSLKHAFWHEPVNIWPLLGFLAGVACLALFDEVALGLICLALAYGSHVLLTWLWLRFQNLDRYALPSGELRSRITELSQKGGITLREIYVLPTAEGRLDAPYMVRRQRLFLSDALLKRLSRAETEAVLAREFVHLRGRHREILVAIAILALPLIYRFSHLAVIEGSLPWAVRGPLLVWLTPAAMYLLWRCFERTTDVEATKLSGVSAAVLEAPIKVAEFNALSLYCRRLEARFLAKGNASAAKSTTEIPTKPNVPERLVSGD